MRFSDRRSNPRVNLSTRVDITLGPLGDQRGLECTDISMSGLCAQCTLPPRPGSEVQFGLRLADRQEPCRGRGRVVWVQPMHESSERRYRLAIHFTELDASSAGAVNDTVRQLLEDSPTMAFPRQLVASLTRH